MINDRTRAGIAVVLIVIFSGLSVGAKSQADHELSPEIQQQIKLLQDILLRVQSERAIQVDQSFTVENDNILMRYLLNAELKNKEKNNASGNAGTGADNHQGTNADRQGQGSGADRGC